MLDERVAHVQQDHPSEGACENPIVIGHGQARIMRPRDRVTSGRSGQICHSRQQRPAKKTEPWINPGSLPAGAATLDQP
jgi:hypothetical protein